MSRVPPDIPGRDWKREDVSQLLSQLRELKARAKDDLPKLWRNLLGIHFDEAAVSRAATIRFVKHPDARVRRGAFGLLRDHWPLDFDLDCLYKNAIVSDPDLEVRCIAIWSLVALYVGTADCNISMFLARVAKDKSQAIKTRRIAYWGVFDVQALTLAPETKLQMLRSENELPKELDWSIIDSLSNGEERGGYGGGAQRLWGENPK